MLTPMPSTTNRRPLDRSPAGCRSPCGRRSAGRWAICARPACRRQQRLRRRRPAPCTAAKPRAAASDAGRVRPQQDRGVEIARRRAPVAPAPAAAGGLAVGADHEAGRLARQRAQAAGFVGAVDLGDLLDPEDRGSSREERRGRRAGRGSAIGLMNRMPITTTASEPASTIFSEPSTAVEGCRPARRNTSP